MPRVRKVPAEQAASWQPERESIDADTLLAVVVGGDRVGLTRMEYPDSWGWMARVFAGGRSYTRFFADGAHGGPEAGLRKAVAWRDAQRTAIGTAPRRGRTWRIVRVERPEWKNVGYFAYADQRRYFSDAAYGGAAGSRAAAEHWLAEQRRVAG
jgi:hypothetical protein